MKNTVKPVLRLMTTMLAGAAITGGALAEESYDINRIVSAGNGVTEIIYALGAGERVVAVDQTSTWPEAVNKLPHLGYHRQLSAEGILALQPTLLIGTQDMGPPATLAQLESAGVEVEVLTVDYSAESIERQIKLLADILDREAEGEALWATIKDSLGAARAMAASYEQKHQKKVPVLFVLAMGGRAPSIAGDGTAANAVIALAGGYNPAAEQFHGYKALSNEALLLLAPEVIVFPGAASNPDMTPEKLLERMPALKQTPAGRHGRVVAIDGNMLLGGLGPRTGEVALSLAKTFYSEEDKASANES